MVAAADRELTGHGSVVECEIDEPVQVWRCFHKVHDGICNPVIKSARFACLTTA